MNSLRLLSGNNATMPRFLGLIAASAVWFFASPAAFASDPARLARVGELATSQEEISNIVRSSLSDEEKARRLQMFVRLGDRWSEVDKVAGKLIFGVTTGGPVSCRYDSGLSIVYGGLRRECEVIAIGYFTRDNRKGTSEHWLIQAKR